MGLHPTPSYIWPDTDKNITWLPLDDPLCANDTCLAFSEAHDASQALISWGSQFLYGHYVLMVWGCILGLAMLAGSARRLQDFHASRSSIFFVEDRPTAGQKALAFVRSVAYRRASGRLANMKKLPNLGMALLAILAWLFAIVLMFAEHPYYRETRGYGSPPLGVRAGLAGTALTPIVFALSGKYNLVTLLTGISHERLNFLHRQCGLIYLFFGVVHTIPFLINDYGSGGPKRLWYQFYNAGSYEYTGIAPLAVLVFLCAFSNPWFRTLAYELFVHTHILAAIAYLGTMFWHCGQQKDSWHYLWASVAIWVIQLAARAWDKTAMFEISHKRRNGIAHISVLDDDSSQASMMRITVQLPLQWTLGQHAFLRFPRLGILDNHPFTIASVPKHPAGQNQQDDKSNELVFLIRPYRGVTKRLLSRTVDKHRVDAEAAPSSKQSGSPDSRIKVRASDSHNVRIDGPYGGVSQHYGMHKLYDQVILVAGGGGISAMLSWLIDLSSRIGDPKEPRRVQRVNLIWCIRHVSAKAWVQEELEECLSVASKSMQIDIYVTGNDGEEMVHSGAEKPSEASEDISEKVSPSSSLASQSQARVQLHRGRPYMPKLLEEMVALRKTLVMGCGPESLKIDLSNAVAKLQSRVMENRAEEVSLHTETFGW